MLTKVAFDCGPMKMGVASPIGNDSDKYWQITSHAHSTSVRPHYFGLRKIIQIRIIWG